MSDKIPVTKSFLPPKANYLKYLNEIWESGWLTNSGGLANSLEKKLEEYLGVKNCILVSNGTIALQLALKALKITKEVITTPYSYVATTNAILWENCKPVFIDIDPKRFSIDTDLIEEAITEKTQAILATNCYGIPSDFEKIEKIANQYNLKVIYDSAHAFKVEKDGLSILNHGDISTLSFHATKLFHTVEGGAIICNDDKISDELKLMRSFGHNGDDYFSLGINGKNSEFHAAMGHCVLEFMPQIIEKRKQLWEAYQSELLGINLIDFSVLEGVNYNYSYFPFVVDNEGMLLVLIQALNANEIYPRRYFYPSLNNLPHNKGETCPISESISKRVICLPLFYELKLEEVLRITTIINRIVL